MQWYHYGNALLLTIVFSSEDLWCNVIGSSTEGAGGVTWSDPLLSGKVKGEKEVSQIMGFVQGNKWWNKKKRKKEAL